MSDKGHERVVLEEWARLNGVDIAELDAEIGRRAAEIKPWLERIATDSEARRAVHRGSNNDK